jgi:hypothetical protein
MKHKLARFGRGSGEAGLGFSIIAGLLAGIAVGTAAAIVPPLPLLFDGLRALIERAS